MFRLVRKLAIGAAMVVAVALVAAVGRAWCESRLPATYDMMAYAVADDGGGPHLMSAMHHPTSVADLHWARGGRPDARFVLTARKADVRLASGATIDALTFDGRAPGRELRVRQGDLIEVRLENVDVRPGVTIHWHGVDVPNAEDGVAGVTQDAVSPGGSYVYRFRAKQAGTFWYHSHEASASQVRRGLYGALVVEPRGPRPRGLDLALVAHDFDGVIALNATDRLERRAVPAGTNVRLRLVNSESTPQRFALAGAAFRVLAIDGADLNGPTPVTDTWLELAAGGRYDIGFAMPRNAVKLSLAGGAAALALSPDGEGDLPETSPRTVFDPSGYGRPAATPFDATSHFDRRFELAIGRKLGFLDGRPGRHWSINGRLFPHVPMLMVERGDLVELTIVNHSGALHPMHLHGHHALVLSRNGRPVTGSPWWVDTLDVGAGERYVLAFRADNPGLWMDHCHNLRHAAAGLMLHLAYAGVESPFKIGGKAHNHPE